MGLVACAFLFVGCSDLGEPLRLAPRAEVSASTLDFGTVALQGASTRSVVIGNAGNAPLTGFASVSCADYTIDSGGGAYTVAPATQHTIVVSYRPTTLGASPCQLLLGGGLPAVDLNGTGALQSPGAQCVLSRTALEFGEFRVGTSHLDVFTIRNPGTAATQLDVVATCGAFSVVGGGGARLLAPGDSLVVTVSFVPQGSGPAACAIAIGPGCPDLPASGFGLTISFVNDLRPILQARGCTGCHGFSQASQLVDVPASGYPPFHIIEPFDPANSVLYNKITGTGRFGQRMPQGGPALPATETNKFRDWILEGARDN